MENALESYEYKGIKINIFADESPESPRTWDNLGRLLIFGGNNFVSVNKTKGEYTGNYSNTDSKAVVLPIYRLEHSGVAYSTTSFNDEWDSRQVGFIIALREDILEEFGGKILTKKLRNKIEEILRGEIETYSQWANGEVYGFVLTELNDEEIDMTDASCWGFYGFDYCKEEAERTADYVAPLWKKEEPVRAHKAYKEMVEAAGQYNLL